MSRRLVAVGISAAVVIGSAGAAYAAITSPTQSPFPVPSDSGGNPQPFTITANGFTPLQPVYVEECDGKTPNVGSWNVTLDCDNGRTTPGNDADGNGNVTFSVGNGFPFTPFKGESPSSLFNCLSPHGAAIGNGLTNYTNCQIRVSSNNAGKTGDEAYLRITLPDAPSDTSTTTTAPTTTTTVPSATHPVGACAGIRALAGIKTADGLGLDNTLRAVKISIKSTPTGAMTCSGLPAADGAVVPGSFKATLGNGLTSEASCNTALVSTALPPAGKFGWAGAAGVEQGYARLTATNPTINYFSDVVATHGIITKGAMAGVDVDGTLFQNPTVKDKTLTPIAPWVGVDTNAQDSFFIGASCQTGGSAGTLAFNDGSGGKGGLGSVPAPTRVTLTLVGDGTSLIDPIVQLVAPATAGKLGPCPCVPAGGLAFSVG
jgi:hypothetical protein